MHAALLGDHGIVGAIQRQQAMLTSLYRPWLPARLIIMAFGVVCCASWRIVPYQAVRSGSKAGDRLSIRLDLASGAKIGPGKIAVLEEIARAGSISAAGRALKMSYRRTWELVEDLNQSLGTAGRRDRSGRQRRRWRRADEGRQGGCEHLSRY